MLWYGVQDPKTAGVLEQLEHHNYITLDPRPTTQVWQALSDHVATGTHMLLGDDVRFFQRAWDHGMMQHSEQPLMINCSNVKPDLTPEYPRHKLPAPHYAVNEAWRRAMGWFCPQGFQHYFVDAWVMRMALVTDCLRSTNSAVIHNKKFNSMQAHNNIEQWRMDRDRMDSGFGQFCADCEKLAALSNTLGQTKKRLEMLATAAVRPWHAAPNFKYF